jgi:hypothetical protein
MKLFKKMKDGGPNSPVNGYFLIEWKGLFSIALLKFNKGSREEYHTHAFNALTWFIKGDLEEEQLYVHCKGNSFAQIFWGLIVGKTNKKYRCSLLPKFTSRENLHRVIAHEDSWCLTIRGPWAENWVEVDQPTNGISDVRVYQWCRVVRSVHRAIWKG